MFLGMQEEGLVGIPINIKTLLEGNVVEHARIEFKETWDPAASLKTICAFANDIDNWGGGYIVIGVREEEDGRALVGVPVEKIDGYLKDMLNKCKLIRPDYMPIVDVASYKDRHFIVVWVPGGSVRPYSSPKSMGKDSKERVFYIRKMASTITPSEEELRELYNLSNNVPFDDRSNHSADIDDMSITLVKEYLNDIGSSLHESADVMSFEDLCLSMNIAAGPTEYIKPKNVGLLFFSSDPARFFPCAEIDVVEFPDGLGGERIIESTFTGPLHHQLRDALRYLRGSIIKEQVVKHPDRAEADRFFNYPYAALEESLSNAVYHKGYDVREPIEVRILPDRIEILSYPGADRSISTEGLRTYRAISRRYRNRRIGDFLKELHLTEGRNTGMAKILRSMRQNGSPDPVFETDGDRLYFLTTLPIHPGFVGTSDGRAAVGASAPRGYAATPEGEEVPSDAERLLAYLAENPTATIARVAHDLGVSTSTVSRAISALKLEGHLGREGSARSGRWVVRG